ncbi:hypothetical protein BKH43_01900 [Helicobacter sp. 13S00401-1]|uniref:tetratricopeptide repeat protein n=1 Tax=Helicobacter sp. 13S00401-1 TaxID=1905758 RepID=UPI000BA4FA87|nr:tetratricopeptide repeat protein [Helicobacter sp. 13S00401-1]PAF51416.1 hypothetical protein BKH43_01900 [Helicobacter sp. 13S00401-1]
MRLILAVMIFIGVAYPLTYKDAYDTYKEGRVSIALGMFDALCSGGDMTACFSAGIFFSGQHGIARDEAKMQSYYQKACNGGIAQACNNLGAEFQSQGGNEKEAKAREKALAKESKRVEKEQKKLAALREKELKSGGFSPSFNPNLSSNLEGQQGLLQGSQDLQNPNAQAFNQNPQNAHNNQNPNFYSPRNYEESRLKAPYAMNEGYAGYFRACNLGNYEACNNLALSYQNGSLGLQANETTATMLFYRACQGGFMESCFYLANAYYFGKGVGQSYENASRLYDLACDNNVANSCLNAGVIYESGQAGVQDLSKALDLYTKACQLGSAQGCKYLSDLAKRYKN